MAVSKKCVATVSKARKGSYKVKLPKPWPKQAMPKPGEKPEVIDAVVIPVVGHAKVHADGTLDLATASKGMRVWRLSKGCYNVDFGTKLRVVTVMVQPVRKERAPRIFARVQPLLRNRIGPTTLNLAEILLANIKGDLRDCEFSVLGITDGSQVP
jgi:hypothetical protein